MDRLCILSDALKQDHHCFQKRNQFLVLFDGSVLVDAETEYNVQK